MEKTKNKPVPTANNRNSHEKGSSQAMKVCDSHSKENSVLFGMEALGSPVLDGADYSMGEQDAKQDSEQSLDLMRKILFGEQARAAEQKQVSLERRLQGSLDNLNKETQQQLNVLRRELQELEQKTEAWRREILHQVEQTGQQLQQGKVDRKVMADLLQGMAEQLSVPADSS